MSDLIGGLQALLPRLGWRIDASIALWADHGIWSYGRRFELISTSPPVGRRVRLDVHDEPWDQQGEVVLVPIEPLRFGEVRFSPRRAAADDFRQLRRALRWFHDPCPGELWADYRGPADWMPPTHWLAEVGVRPDGLDVRWPSCADPEEMLRYLGSTPSERQLRLLACALARQLPVTMLPAVNRHIVAFAEQHAEGLCPRRELKKAAKGTALRWLLAGSATEAVAAGLAALRGEAPSNANAVAAGAVREVFGNPFVPVNLRHLWLRLHGGAARDLVNAIATAADFALLPVLADALEDGGCTDAHVLNHARSGGPHVRGCWLIDRLREL